MPAALIAIVAVSVLFSVIALYRDDDLLLSAFLLAVITGLGYPLDAALVSAVQTGSIGPVFILGVPLLLTTLIRVLVLAPFLVAAVWLARRCRRFLAPDTVG